MTGCQQKSEDPTEVNIGMTAIENQDYTAALTSFQQAITAETDLVQAYRGEGMAYMGLGRYQEAADSFAAALQETSEKQKETRQDIRQYQAAALYKQGDLTGTIAVCDELLAESPSGDAYYLRGACYMDQGESEKAKVDFDSAIKQRPEDYDLYMNIYASYEDKKQSAQGAEYLQQALAIESDDEQDAYQKARVYYFLENYEQAQAQLTPLIGEKHAEALLLMGKVYQALEDYPHARSMYEQYIAEYGGTTVAYNGIVLADIAEGNYDIALENIALGRVLPQEQGKQELSYNEIIVYEHKQDFATAREKAQAYVEQYPTDELGQKEYQFLQTR